MYLFFRSINHNCKPAGAKEWWFDLVFYLFDLLGVAEIQQFISGLFKWNIRKLSKEELAVGKRIFGNAIDFSRVRIDDTAKLGIETIAIAYVGFNTINFNNKIKKEVFIHELVHIWQYQKYGSLYIGRAIKAQKSPEGYDYGGIENLYNIMLKNGRLMDFNFEQQAEIIEDYYKITKNPSNVHPMIINIYTYFVGQVKK